MIWSIYQSRDYLRIHVAFWVCLISTRGCARGECCVHMDGMAWHPPVRPFDLMTSNALAASKLGAGWMVVLTLGTREDTADCGSVERQWLIRLTCCLKHWQGTLPRKTIWMFKPMLVVVTIWMESDRQRRLSRYDFRISWIEGTFRR